MTENKRVKPSALEVLGAYTVNALTAEEREPPEFIVDGMIPVGMTFLVGAPKIRKSFLAMQLAYAVATGGKFLGVDTIKSDVLYLDLEGSKSRVSTRTSQMFDRMPDNLYIANRTKVKISDGSLIATLTQLRAEMPSIRLIIIDTYARARGNVRSNGSNAYDGDVALLEPVQQFAIDAKIALLFVHHERKGAAMAQDIFERASGSMGIVGSADSLMNLTADGKRFDGKASLEYTPRDARGGEMKLAFNDASCIWETVSAFNEIEGMPLVRFCVDNAPDVAQSSGVFFSYQDAFRMAYGAYAPIDAKAGDRVRKILMETKNDVYQKYDIAMHIGAKSHGERGVRLFRVG